MALKRSGFVQICSVLILKRAGFGLVDVQGDVILLSCLHVTAFSVDQLLCRWRFVICLPYCVNETLFQVAGHSGWCRGQVSVQYIHVPASVHKFCSQPDCLANTDLAR